MIADWDAELCSVNMLPHALAYARKGWKVFPAWWCSFASTCACPKGGGCPSPGKHPMTRSGYKDATDNAETITEWWQASPHANIAIATGEPSGLFVLDVDGEEGQRSISRLIRRHGRPPPTPAAVTGAGGRHVYWRHDPSGKNRARVAPGLDIRSTGGHVIAPPSLHESGDRYTWHGAGHPRDVALQPAPSWVLRLIGTKRRNPNGHKGPRRFDRMEIAKLPRVEEGRRNDMLFWVACELRRNGRSEDEVTAGVDWVNRNKCVNPLPKKEIEKILGSARARA